jgi:hypothetical protein
MSTIADLAAASLLVPDFNIDSFIVVRAYADTAKYVHSEGVTLVHVTREKSVEDDKTFADGGDTSSRGTIEARVYWLVDGVRVCTSCAQEYRYKTNASYSGVDYAEIQNSKYDIHPEIVISHRVHRLLKAVTSLAALSVHDDVQQYIEENTIPYEFADRVLRVCNMRDAISKFEIAVSEKKPWSEWENSSRSSAGTLTRTVSDTTYQRPVSPRSTYQRPVSPRSTYQRPVNPRSTYQRPMSPRSPGSQIPAAFRNLRVELPSHRNM